MHNYLRLQRRRKNIDLFDPYLQFIGKYTMRRPKVLKKQGLLDRQAASYDCRANIGFACSSL